MDLLDALRRGEIVALQGDRPRAGGRTLEARLFGRPFALPVGPAALARAAGVPIVPVFVLREGRLRYRCVLRPAIAVAQSEDRQRDLARGARALRRRPRGGHPAGAPPVVLLPPALAGETVAGETVIKSS